MRGYPATCSICGGPGVAYDVRTLGAMWLGEASHSDPRVCRSYLRMERPAAPSVKADES